MTNSTPSKPPGFARTTVSCQNHYSSFAVRLLSAPSHAATPLPCQEGILCIHCVAPRSVLCLDAGLDAKRSLIRPFGALRGPSLMPLDDLLPGSHAPILLMTRRQTFVRRFVIDDRRELHVHDSMVHCQSSRHVHSVLLEGRVIQSCRRRRLRSLGTINHVAVGAGNLGTGFRGI